MQSHFPAVVIASGTGLWPPSDYRATRREICWGSLEELFLRHLGKFLAVTLFFFSLDTYSYLGDHERETTLRWIWVCEGQGEGRGNNEQMKKSLMAYWIKLFLKPSLIFSLQLHKPIIVFYFFSQFELGFLLLRIQHFFIDAVTFTEHLFYAEHAIKWSYVYYSYLIPMVTWQEKRNIPIFQLKKSPVLIVQWLVPELAFWSRAVWLQSWGSTPCSDSQLADPEEICSGQSGGRKVERKVKSELWADRIDQGQDKGSK